MTSSYSILAHPSDLGIEARGATPAEAFEAVARGLVSVILDPATVEAREERRIALTASDPEQLLVRWLSEILYLYDGTGFVGREFLVNEITPRSLRATTWGESFRQGVHGTRLDVKAVTYHQISVREYEGGAMVRVYLDI